MQVLIVFFPMSLGNTLQVRSDSLLSLLNPVVINNKKRSVFTPLRAMKELLAGNSTDSSLAAGVANPLTCEEEEERQTYHVLLINPLLIKRA